MRAARVELPGRHDLVELVTECAQRAFDSYRQDVLVKVDVTRGVFDYYRDPTETYEDAHLYLHGIRIPFWKFADKYETGIAVAYPVVRQGSAESLDLRMKHRSRIYQAIAEREARDVDAEAQALLLDSEGYVAEGTGSNVFMVVDGAVLTPSAENCLEGVSRGFVIGLCRNLGIPVREERLRPYDLLMADEVFATATSYCLLPIVRAQGRPAGGGECGPVTRRIREAWIEAVGVDFVAEAKAESTPRAVTARDEPARSGAGEPVRVV
jgi:branched-chain amino acid aminotransferase